MATRGKYVHAAATADDDDPFYDHEEATQQHLANAATAASARKSSVTNGNMMLLRPTLHRATSAGHSSAGRPTTTFDDFLSDGSSSDDDDDDGGAIQRMQEQADDMEYIDTSFQLDSPNGSVGGYPNDEGDADDSFRMETPPSAIQAPAPLTHTPSAARVSQSIKVSVDADSDSDGSEEHDDDDSDGDIDGSFHIDNSITRGFMGHNDSFIDKGKRGASDDLDSSFRLISPNAVAANSRGSMDGDDDSFVGGRPSGLDSSGGYSGEFDDSSFVIHSPNSGGGYLDDNDSFVAGDRPSNLDDAYKETLDDSFAGDRPSHLDVDYDDSFASDRPSNLDTESFSETLDDSFIGDTTGTLEVKYSETLGDSFAGERPGNVDAGDSGTLDDSLVGRMPSVENGHSAADVGERRSSEQGGDRDDAFDDSFVGGHSDEGLTNSMVDIDYSFRDNSLDGDYLEDNDSFIGAATADIIYGDYGDEDLGDRNSSFVLNSPNGGFDEVSQQAEEEHRCDQRYSNNCSAELTPSRVSTESSSPSSSFSRQTSFFVGSAPGSFPDDMSFAPLASSPALSDVAMLGGDGESSSLEQHSYVLRASSDVNPRVSGSNCISAATGEFDGGNMTAQNASGEPFLPPIITANIRGVGAAVVAESASGSSSDPRSSSASSSSSIDDLSFVSFTGAKESPGAPQRSGGEENSGSLDQSPATKSETDISFVDCSFRLSSPEDNAARKSELNSFISESSGGSFVDESFSSSVYSEIAARHLESRPSETDSANGSGKPTALMSPLQAVSPPQCPTKNSIDAAETGLGTSRPTDEKIDFTGVYRESGQSLENTRGSHHGRSALESAHASALGDNERESAFAFAVAPVALTRARSDSVQRASERKVEDFFRRTYNFTKDDDSQDFVTRRTRARTTVAFKVYEEEGEERDSIPAKNDAARQRSKSTGAKKTIDLRSLKPGHSAFVLQAQNAGPGYVARSRGVSRASSRLQIKEDLLDIPDAASERKSRLTFGSSGVSSSSLDSAEDQILSERMQGLRQHSAANEMNASRVLQRNFTISISSDARSSGLKSTLDSSSEDSPNMIPMPPRYMLSPNAETPKNVDNAPVFSISQGLKRSAMATRADQDNGNSTTPALPRLSVASSSLTPSPFSASYAGPASSKISMGNGTPGMAPGFKWNAQQHLQQLDSRSEGSGMGMKESIWHEAAIPRPTLSGAVANQFHRFSSSLRNTLRRTGVRFLGQQTDPTLNGPTSPQSVCSAPPKLSRGYDDRNFYVRFGRGGGVEDNDEVIAAKQALGQNQNPENVFKKRHARAMVILLCAVLGIGVGIGLIHVDALASAFNLPREKQLAQRLGNGELKVSMTTQWILLPGKLFLRIWNCVTMPLLFCHILNGIADMRMNSKASLVLSFRTFGYMLALSVFSTFEGLGMMAAVKTFGWFGGSNSSVKVTAATLRKSLGVADRKNGSVALMCESTQSYLQVSNNGQTFRCSNDSIPLPVYEGVVENGTSRGNSAAIFVLNDVNGVLAANEPSESDVGSAMYYPKALRLEQIGRDFVNAVVPSNAVDSLLHSTPVSTVAIALLLGVVCGKRAWERGIVAKQQVASSRIDAAAAGHVADKPHYLLGVFVELQLALEWIVDVLETLAPIGVASLLAGNIVLHREELMTFVSPMMQLILGVALICTVHVVVVMPIFMKVLFKVNVFRSWTAFLPAYLLCFCTGSVVLSLPTAQQCYERGNVVTKSMSQVAMGISSVVHRNAHAIYYPMAILWLLQTNTQASDVELTSKLVLLIGGLTLVSCFVAFHPVASVVSGTSGGSNLLLTMTLWRAVLTFSSNSPAAAMTPPTFPLFVACDVLLSRLISMVNLHDNILVTRMIAEHCDEAVVEGTKLPVNSVDLAPSPMYI